MIGGLAFRDQLPGIVREELDYQHAHDSTIWSAEHNADGTHMASVLAPSNTPWIDPRNAAYGGVGDGTTDDTLALTKAISAAQSAGGGTILLPPGSVWRVTTGLTLPNYVTLEGRGYYGSMPKILVAADIAPVTMFSYSGLKRVLLQPLAAAVAHPAVSIGAGQLNWLLEDVWILDSDIGDYAFHTGIDITGGLVGNILRPVIMDGGSTYGIKAINSGTTHPNAIFIESPWIRSTTGTGIYVEYAEGMTIVAPLIQTCLVGLALKNVGTPDTQGVDIFGGYWEQEVTNIDITLDSVAKFNMYGGRFGVAASHLTVLAGAAAEVSLFGTHFYSTVNQIDATAGAIANLRLFGCTVNLALLTGTITNLGLFGCNSNAGAVVRTQVDTLAVADGVTAPAAVVGQALIYVDTADGDLKVKFGDGTTKVLAADT